MRRVLGTLGVAALLALALAGVGVQRSLGAAYAGWEGAHVDVVLEPGMGAGVMLERLAAAGVLRHPRVARTYLSVTGATGRLHAGEYRFEQAASALSVLGRIREGDVLLHAVTIPEGLNFFEIADRFAAAGFGDREALLAAFRDPQGIEELDPQARDLEGYLFPDTYRFPRDTPPTAIAERMVRRFRDVIGEDYAARSEVLGLGLRGAVTLASLIEKETSVPDERPLISRVFHNRLERGMKLDCDPTVMYALHRAGRPVERLRQKHLTFASPWNTYTIRGLPVGPIANPGRESLMAALAPVGGKELYFVAAPGGGHRFSNSFNTHLRAVAEWRRYLGSRE